MKKRTKKDLKKELKIGTANNSELNYLDGLMKDFPCGNDFKIEYANELLASRYDYLEKEIPLLLSCIKDGSLLPNIAKMFPNIENEKDKLPKSLYFLMRFFHFYLFENILNNAGEFRKTEDPNNGEIGFGGANRRIAGNFNYPGAPCNQIKQRLIKCFTYLEDNTDDPVYSSMCFYREFVKIHPFYDANGRIGRLILSIYNLHHGYYIRWREIDEGGNKNEFIKKLNRCHVRETNEDKYKEYLEYLPSFFRKFVISISELTDENQ